MNNNVNPEHSFSTLPRLAHLTIFNQLSNRDLCALSQTSKNNHRTVNQYSFFKAMKQYSHDREKGAAFNLCQRLAKDILILWPKNTIAEMKKISRYLQYIEDITYLLIKKENFEQRSAFFYDDDSFERTNCISQYNVILNFSKNNLCFMTNSLTVLPESTRLILFRLIGFLDDRQVHQDFFYEIQYLNNFCSVKNLQSIFSCDDTVNTLPSPVDIDDSTLRQEMSDGCWQSILRFERKHSLLLTLSGCFLYTTKWLIILLACVKDLSDDERILCGSLTGLFGSLSVMSLLPFISNWNRQSREARRHEVDIITHSHLLGAPSDNADQDNNSDVALQMTPYQEDEIELITRIARIKEYENQYLNPESVGYSHLI